MEVNIPDLAEEVYALLANSAAAKGLDFDLTIDPSLDRTVLGDPRRIRQVLTNVVGNAIKFTERGGIEVSVTAEERCVRFQVRDTGPGVDPARLGAIFEEFSQADASTSRTIGGTGLGLAISKRLAEAMGGTIDVSSEPGQGSTFWFTVELTAEVGSPVASGCALVGRRAVAVLGGVPGSATLHHQLRSWVAMLNRLGYSVDVARNGREAVEMRAQNDYAAVLMDCRMPELDGYEATREIGQSRTVDAGHPSSP